MGEIWAIILAAGESKRMGSPKLLLPFNGRTMLDTVIGNVLASAVDNTIVVLGANQELFKEIIDKSAVNCCHNDNYKEGMLSSVKCGFRNLPLEIDAAMVFQGDQPLISPEVINTVIKAYRSSGKGIVVPVFENKRGHPLLIDRKFFLQIEKLENHEGLHSLSHLFPDDVLEVDTDKSGILRDFDTYEEYRNGIN